MKYRPEHYPEDWRELGHAYPKAFTLRDPSALRLPSEQKEIFFRRLSLAFIDLEDAGYAAECLIDWQQDDHVRDTVSIMSRPEHINQRRDLLLRTCYETTLTVAYSRPFNASDGLPKIGFSRIGLIPKSSTNAIVEKLKKYRNKYFAHSDEEVRRYVPPMLVEVSTSRGEPFERMSNPIFPRGGVFSEAELHQISVVIWDIQIAIRKTMQQMVNCSDVTLQQFVLDEVTHP
jgi:hypothetical protein